MELETKRALLAKNKNIEYTLEKFTNHNVSNADADIQAIEVKIGHIHKMNVVNCYRHHPTMYQSLPNTLSQFWTVWTN